MTSNVNRNPGNGAPVADLATREFTVEELLTVPGAVGLAHAAVRGHRNDSARHALATAINATSRPLDFDAVATDALAHSAAKYRAMHGDRAAQRMLADVTAAYQAAADGPSA
jgi:hypothetical protein